MNSAPSEYLPLHQLNGRVESAWYVAWVEAPAHIRPVPGVSYEQLPTTHLSPPSAVDEILGFRGRLSGWVLQKLDARRGPGRGVLHAPDCDEAPQGKPVLELERALDAAEKVSVRLCSLCGAEQELEPLLRGFDHGFAPDR